MSDLVKTRNVRRPAVKQSVKPAAKPRASKQPAKPRSMPEVMASGDRRESLIALRDHLAERLLVADRDAAPLARQLTIVLNELDAIPAPEMESTLDDLASRRSARRAASSG